MNTPLLETEHCQLSMRVRRYLTFFFVLLCVMRNRPHPVPLFCNSQFLPSKFHPKSVDGFIANSCFKLKCLWFFYNKSNDHDLNVKIPHTKSPDLHTKIGSNVWFHVGVSQVLPKNWLPSLKQANCTWKWAKQTQKERIISQPLFSRGWFVGFKDLVKFLMTTITTSRGV